MHGSAEPRSAGGAHGEQAVRLLVVEHSSFFRHLLQPLLQGAGFDVVTVRDAPAALALRERGERFDAIISDIDLPGIDGHAFARACRAGGPWQGVPLIALTSRLAEEDIAAARGAGFDHQIEMLDGEAFLGAVHQAVGMGW